MTTSISAQGPDDAADLLRRYLRDHWAAAGAGSKLADRLYRRNRDTPWGHQLERVSREVSSDDAALNAVRHALGSRGGRLRRLALEIGSTLGQFKLNGRLTRYSPLSRVFEAEAMMSGILAKQRMWLTLEESLGPERAEADFAMLAERAGAQLDTVANFHQWALAMAFRPEPGTGGPSSMIGTTPLDTTAVSERG